MKLKEVLIQEEASSYRLLADKDHERAEIHAKNQEHLGEYEQLPWVTLAVDMEINAYPKLLREKRGN